MVGMVVLEAREGLLVVHTGTYAKYNQFILFPVQNAPERLGEVVEALGYKEKKRWTDGMSTFVEVNERSASRVARRVSELLRASS